MQTQWLRGHYCISAVLCYFPVETVLWQKFKDTLHSHTAYFVTAFTESLGGPQAAEREEECLWALQNPPRSIPHVSPAHLKLNTSRSQGNQKPPAQHRGHSAGEVHLDSPPIPLGLA